MQLGVHYALSAPQEQQLLAVSGDDEVMELVEEIEESGESLHVDTDKAWDAIHRCLSDGTLDPEGGEYPLSHAILGGRQLHDGEDYFVSYVSAEQVHDVAVALAQIDESALRQRFDALDPADYDGSKDEDDFEYTWTNLQDVAQFFAQAAEQGHSVIFTVAE